MKCPGQQGTGKFNNFLERSLAANQAGTPSPREGRPILPLERKSALVLLKRPQSFSCTHPMTMTITTHFLYLNPSSRTVLFFSVPLARPCRPLMELKKWANQISRPPYSLSLYSHTLFILSIGQSQSE